MLQKDDRTSKAITVAEFLRDGPKELGLELLTKTSDLNSHFISSHRTQKLGLALTGFHKYLHPGRLKMVGQSEVEYLLQLRDEDRRRSFDDLDPVSITCIVLVKSLPPPKELLAYAKRHSVPLIRSPLVSSKAIGLITDYLLEALAPQVSVHGVLLEMYGIGVLIIGDSGIGKSECALDLVTRGHRLVADDAVLIKRIGDHLDGASPKLTFEHLEIRGLGIINVREIFGVASVCDSMRISLCIELRKWDDIDNIERIGLEMCSHDVFGVEMAKFVLPVSSGRNIGTLVETAVKVYMLRCTGVDPAARLVEKHLEMINQGTSDTNAKVTT
jgi:HPr kinase/phosphorylase